MIKMATPRLAPELIPNTKGPASGFLNKVCINSPLIDSPAPTSIAVNDFGNRKLRIIYSHDSFDALPRILLKISSIGILTEPRLILVNQQAININESALKVSLYDFL